MTQVELAKRLGYSTKHINQVIKGKASISSDFAVSLFYVLGIPAYFWLNLETQYQEAAARLADEARMKEEALLVKEFCYAEASRRGWVKSTRDSCEKVIELRKYLQVSSLSHVEDLYPASFRIGKCKKTSIGALAMWLRQGELIGKAKSTNKYNEKSLRDFIGMLKQICAEADAAGLEKAGSILADCGVALAVVPQLEGTNVLGAAMKLAPDKYVIEMSLRGKWADIFWFSLFHEIGHILLSHVKETWSINFDDAAECYHKNQAEEDAANEFARDQLIIPAIYEGFKSNHDFSRESIKEFAADEWDSPGNCPWKTIL